MNKRDTRIVFECYGRADWPDNRIVSYYVVMAGRGDGYKVLFGPARWAECVAWRKKHLA